MAEAPVLEDTERTTGRVALRKNIAAAMALSGAVRSTLGPRGLDKLLLDDQGRTLVTNDGVTVLIRAANEGSVEPNGGIRMVGYETFATSAEPL